MADAMYRINDRLWQGALRTIIEDPNRDELLADVDVAIVCFEPPPWEVLPFDRGVLLRIPFDDNADGTDDDNWKRLYHLTHAVLSHHAKVLTICAMGENRSGLISAMLLHAREGLTGEACIEEVRKHVMPRSGQPYTLWNPGFCRQIRERLT